MEVEKRKRLEDGELIDHRKKVMMKSGSQIETADDDEKKKAADADVLDHEGDDDKEDDGEVEEFFEILKRIRVAVKYFEKGDGGDGRRRREMMARPRAWNPSFEREDFEGFKVEKGSEESVEQNAVLDLNADPADT